MTWSYEDNRFKITGCEPKRAHAGEQVTVAIEGRNRGARRDGDAWFALLVPIEHDLGAPSPEELPPHFRAAAVRYAHGAGDRFAMTAEFDLPPGSRGHYQLVLGRDDAKAVGEHARFLVDADDFDGAFVIA